MSDVLDVNRRQSPQRHRDTKKEGKWGLTLGGNGSHRFQQPSLSREGSDPISPLSLCLCPLW
jgi:hypothetical protein